MDYVHLPQGSDAQAGHGITARWDERTMKYHGREVLYLLTDAVVDTVCCGDRVFRYATVVGYVLEWRKSKTGSGLDISSVDADLDDAAREGIEAMLRADDPELQVSFRRLQA